MTSLELFICTDSTTKTIKIDKNLKVSDLKKRLNIKNNNYSIQSNNKILNISSNNNRTLKELEINNLSNIEIIAKLNGGANPRIQTQVIPQNTDSLSGETLCAMCCLMCCGLGMLIPDLVFYFTPNNNCGGNDKLIRIYLLVRFCLVFGWGCVMQWFNGLINCIFSESDDIETYNKRTSIMLRIFVFVFISYSIFGIVLFSISNSCNQSSVQGIWMLIFSILYCCSAPSYVQNKTGGGGGDADANNALLGNN